MQPRAFPVRGSNATARLSGARRTAAGGSGVDWNVVITVKRGPGFESQLLGALARFGRFRRTDFRDVIAGRVESTQSFLEALGAALAEGKRWVGWIARVIPVEQVFFFTPETLTQRLMEATAPFAERLADGSFCVRIERRGLAGQLATPEIERAVGEHLHALAAERGLHMRTQFADPDYAIVAETLGEECGVGFISRALRERFPFVQVR
jgi:tRNA(Ser,Leu) C12 N-acetylase TAN1